MGVAEVTGLVGLVLTAVVGSLGYFALSQEQRREWKLFYFNVSSATGRTILRVLSVAIPVVMTFLSMKGIVRFQESEGPMTRAEVVSLAVNVVNIAFYLSLGVSVTIGLIVLSKQKRELESRANANEEAQQ